MYSSSVPSAVISSPVLRNNLLLKLGYFKLMVKQNMFKCKIPVGNVKLCLDAVKGCLLVLSVLSSSLL